MQREGCADVVGTCGNPFSPRLLSGVERRDLVKSLIKELEGRIARADHARSLSDSFCGYHKREESRRQTPLAKPSAMVVGSYQVKFNSPPTAGGGEEELVSQACEYVKALTKGDEGGSFPQFPPFTFTFGQARDALASV